MEKFMWNHAREISPWFFAAKVWATTYNCIKSNDFAHRIQCAINLYKHVQNKNKNVQYTKTHLRTHKTIVQKNEQYFVQNWSILYAIKTSIILCKTLCNVVQYMNKTFVQSFSILLLCKKTVQYFVKISAILAHKKFIAQFCIYCSILWTILERLGLQMNGRGAWENARWSGA